MNQRTELHSCGLLRDKENKNIKLVVSAGGRDHNSEPNPGLILDIVEFWNVGKSNGWEIGPTMPRPVSRGYGIVTPDGHSFLIVGGSPATSGEGWETIVQLQCFSGDCRWKEMFQRLEYSRKGPVAWFVSKDDYGHFCNEIEETTTTTSTTPPEPCATGSGEGSNYCIDLTFA